MKYYKSYAKINIFLNINGKRDDGYHDIETLFVKIGLHDVIGLKKSDKLILECNKADIPTDSSNIILKVDTILKTEYGLKDNYHIKLEKNIPAGGGLGGGSGNAAVYLKAVNELSALNVSMLEMEKIMARVGSDTVFFLHDKPMLAEGRGEILHDGPQLPECFVLLVNPLIHVPTGQIYSSPNLKLTPRGELTRMRHAYTYESLLGLLKNGMEPAVFALYPEVGHVRELLLKSGADSALMSGSGATVFGLFSTEEKLNNSFQYITKNFPDYFTEKTYILKQG